MLYTLWQLLSRRKATKSSSSSPSYRLGSYRTGDSARKPAKKFKHPLSMPNDTANGSDERIVVPDRNGVRSDINAGGADYSGHSGALSSHGTEMQGITVQTELSVQSTQDDGTKDEVSDHGFPGRRTYNQYNV